MTFYETVKSAIATCITAVDPTARQYDYDLGSAIDTSPQSLYALFSVLDTGVPTGVLSTYMFTRIDRPDMSTVYATSATNKEVRTCTTTWQIGMLKSQLLPVINSDVTTPSEYDAQNKVDSLIRELFLNDSIIALANSTFKARVLNVSLTEFSSDYMAGETPCHHANILLTLEYKDY